MKMENDIREDMEEMFDYERKPYLQRIFGHLCIYHHKTHLHVWFSVVRVQGSADCCQSGPGCGLRGSRGSNTAHAHIALSTNCSPAAAGLHEMAGHRVTVTPSVKLRYDVIYLVHFYDTSVLFSQLFASRKLRALC